MKVNHIRKFLVYRRYWYLCCFCQSNIPYMIKSNAVEKLIAALRYLIIDQPYTAIRLVSRPCCAINPTKINSLEMSRNKISAVLYIPSIVLITVVLCLISCRCEVHYETDCFL